MNTNNFKEILANSTLEQAIAWNESSEQFTHCIDLLEISAHDSDSDIRVNALELHYQMILSEADIQIN